MVTTWFHHRTIKTMAATAVIAAITSLTIIPLITLLSSLFKSDTAIWAHLVEFVLPDLLRNTAYLLAGVALCTTLLGTTLGWLLGVCEFPGYRWWRLLLLLPLALPAYVVAFVWVALFDSTGLVTLWLREHLFSTNWFSIRSTVGAILIMSLSFYPYVYLTARTAFEAQSKRLNEAAHSVGLNATQTFFKIDLPLARPAIMAGLLLVMMEVLADFGAVSVLNYNTFTTAIYKTWFSLFSLSAAAQLSGILVMIVMVIIIISQWNRGQKSYFVNSRINHQPKRIRLHGKQAVAASVFCAFVFVVAVAIPFGTLLFWAANQLHLLLDARYVYFIRNSFLLASCGSFIIVCVALTLSYTQRATKLPSLFLLGRFATIGYALPGTVLAVGVYIPLAWINQQWNAVQTSLGLASSVLIGGVLSILIGYCARFLAVAEGPIRTGLLRLSPQMDEASKSLGLSTGKRLWLIDAPLLKSSILTAALLCFVDLMKELPITLMMRPFDWDTLAVRIFELISESAWQEASLPALLIVMVGLLPIILLNRR